MQLRCIYTSTNLKSQIGRIMNKVLSSDTTKKSRHKNPNSHSSVPESFNSITSNNKVATHVNRRVTVLNKIFMKYITDLMATGEVAPSLQGKGIEISHIKVAPDFKKINVFWFAENEIDENEDTELILKKSAGHLQHELSQLRVIGKVPSIQFVRNKKYGVIKEVESRLSKVDFGEDYVPTTYISPTALPILKTNLSPTVKAKISELNNRNKNKNESEIETEEKYKIRLPEMKQDILGFDHSAIMNKIKTSLSKSKIAEKNRILKIEPLESIESQASASDIEGFLSKNQENQQLNDFLKQRMIEEKRRLRARPLKECKLEDEKEWFDKLNNDDFVEDPYIEEEYRDEYNDIESYK